MTKIISCIIFIAVFVLFSDVWGRVSYKPGDTLYILTSSGLNMRDQPSKTGKVIVLVPYGSSVKLAGTTEEKESIDNISGTWVEAEYNGKKGFLFGGYLTSLRPPVKDEDVIKYANRVFEKGKLETISKDAEGGITVQHYKNGASLTNNYSNISSITELVIPGISIEEGFLILRLLAQPVFRNERYPVESKTFREKLGDEVWDTDVTVKKDTTGAITYIDIMKGSGGISLGFKVTVDEQGMVTLYQSAVD